METALERKGKCGDGMTDISTVKAMVTPIAQRHGVKRVYLFGSRARGDDRPDSDYDFLITKGNVTTLWRMASLWEDMEETLHAPVDVITDTSSDNNLLTEAKKDAVLLYERME